MGGIIGEGHRVTNARTNERTNGWTHKGNERSAC